MKQKRIITVALSMCLSLSLFFSLSPVQTLLALSFEGDSLTEATYETQSVSEETPSEVETTEALESSKAEETSETTNEAQTDDSALEKVLDHLGMPLILQKEDKTLSNKTAPNLQGSQKYLQLDYTGYLLLQKRLELFEEINRFRLANSLPALDFNPLLETYANQRAAELILSYQLERPDGTPFKQASEPELDAVEEAKRQEDLRSRSLDFASYSNQLSDELIFLQRVEDTQRGNIFSSLQSFETASRQTVDTLLPLYGIQDALYFWTHSDIDLQTKVNTMSQDAQVLGRQSLEVNRTSMQKLLDTRYRSMAIAVFLDSSGNVGFSLALSETPTTLTTNTLSNNVVMAENPLVETLATQSETTKEVKETLELTNETSNEETSPSTSSVESSETSQESSKLTETTETTILSPSPVPELTKTPVLNTVKEERKPTVTSAYVPYNARTRVLRSALELNSFENPIQLKEAMPFYLFAANVVDGLNTKLLLKNDSFQLSPQNTNVFAYSNSVLRPVLAGQSNLSLSSKDKNELLKEFPVDVPLTNFEDKLKGFDSRGDLDQKYKDSFVLDRYYRERLSGLPERAAALKPYYDSMMAFQRNYANSLRNNQAGNTNVFASPTPYVYNSFNNNSRPLSGVRQVPTLPATTTRLQYSTTYTNPVGKTGEQLTGFLLAGVGVLVLAIFLIILRRKMKKDNED